MRYPWANTILLGLLIVQLITGVGALMSGAPRLAWVLWLHVIGAYAALVVLVWKSAVIVRAIERRPRITAGRIAFLLLTALLALTLTTGFLWSYAGPSYVGGFSLLTVHGFLAVAMVLLLIWHTVARWFVTRVPGSRDRRALLRFGGIALVGLLFWRGERPLQGALALPGAERRFTGSYETGSFTGRFPRVSWLFDNPEPVDAATWSLRIEGAVERPLTLSLAEIEEWSETSAAALLDCTGGWYTTQEWRGLSLRRLLDEVGVHPTARSVTVESITGYARRFSLTEIEDYLLATHVADEPLVHGHGFPLRLVAPGKRGFEWVKWITTIRVNETNKIWQSPLPLQ